VREQAQGTGNLSDILQRAPALPAAVVRVAVDIAIQHTDTAYTLTLLTSMLHSHVVFTGGDGETMHQLVSELFKESVSNGSGDSSRQVRSKMTVHTSTLHTLFHFRSCDRQQQQKQQRQQQTALMCTE
jgi:hypothetical protein